MKEYLRVCAVTRLLRGFLSQVYVLLRHICGRVFGKYLPAHHVKSGDRLRSMTSYLSFSGTTLWCLQALKPLASYTSWTLEILSIEGSRVLDYGTMQAARSVRSQVLALVSFPLPFKTSHRFTAELTAQSWQPFACLHPHPVSDFFAQTKTVLLSHQVP